MKARSGQVAVYLVAVLVALCVLMIMNVNIFLAVRGKNRAMNAGDAAALAVADYQKQLINEVGRLNIDHLKAALGNDAIGCSGIMEEQKRICFLEPLNGITIGDEVAVEHGVMRCSDGVAKVLQRHVDDVRKYYAPNPDIYPPPWDGAWEEYATKLETLVGGGLAAGPDNAEFLGMKKLYPLYNPMFYEAIAGRNWCWFHFNGEEALDYNSDELPHTDGAVRFKRADNCEIYPLHLEFESWREHGSDGDADGIFGESWTNLIMTLTGCSEADISAAPLLTNDTQVFAFYDSRWNKWSTYQGIQMRPEKFPIAGEIKKEYDVCGCAAICRVEYPITELLKDGTGERMIEWTAAAKPFGTVQNRDDETDVVTAWRHFVTGGDPFSEAKLVPVDSVGGNAMMTANEAWMTHIHDHLNEYKKGTACWYCNQLKLWDMDSFRDRGKRWLDKYSGTCERAVDEGDDYYGGTAHGH